MANHTVISDCLFGPVVGCGESERDNDPTAMTRGVSHSPPNCLLSVVHATLCQVSWPVSISSGCYPQRRTQVRISNALYKLANQMKVTSFKIRSQGAISAALTDGVETRSICCAAVETL